MQKIISLIKLIRLHNCLMAGIGVWLGAYLADGDTADINIFFASLAAAFVCGGGNALNDYLDIESDKLNHPKRPLPSGKLPPFLAIVMASTFNIAAIIAAAMVNMVIVIIVVLSIIILAVYNFHLKKMPLLGNFVISIFGGMTFIVGGLAVNKLSVFILPGPAVPALFASLYHMGRELIKDIADFEGDIKVDGRSLMSVLSRNSILAIVSVLYALLVLLTLIPAFQQWYRPAYAYIAVFLVDIPILAVLIYLWIGQSEAGFGKAGSILKLLMLFGLLAFFLGKI